MSDKDINNFCLETINYYLINIGVKTDVAGEIILELSIRHFNFIYLVIYILKYFSLK